MTEVAIPNGLPLLAIGTHERASGKACIMNAISYLNGDIDITDAPDCVDPMLSAAAICVNDSICPPEHRGGRYTDNHDVMCGSCSHQVWLLGARIMGTGEAGRDFRNIHTRRRVAVAFGQALFLRYQEPSLEVDLHGSSPMRDSVAARMIYLRDGILKDKPQELLEVAHLLVDIYYRLMPKPEPVEWSEEDYHKVAEEAGVLVVQ